MKKLEIKETPLTITLPGTGPISIGPGTVPTSAYGAQTTSIKKIITNFRRASRLGIFETSTTTNGTS